MKGSAAPLVSVLKETNLISFLAFYCTPMSIADTCNFRPHTSCSML